MRLTVLGAAREVTGSCYLVETATARFLVDCGLRQGGREAQGRNRRPFEFDPSTLDFVLLNWVAGFRKPPSRVLVTHGEAATPPEPGAMIEWPPRRPSNVSTVGGHQTDSNRRHAGEN